MTYKELIAAFAKPLDVSDAIGDDGSLVLEIDGTRVSFREVKDAVAVSAFVCTMPEDDAGRIADVLLKASALMATSGTASVLPLWGRNPSWSLDAMRWSSG